MADASKPYGNVAYADPGYQADKKARYPIDSKSHSKSAWSYINQADNAKLYTPAQLKRIKGRIKAALKRFGVRVSESVGWTVEAPVELIAEHYGDPDSCGSYSITASNGPTSLTICGYGLDPAELDAILQAACDGACAALMALDPDMDGDIDVAGAPDADTDGDFGTLGTESAPDEDDPADAGTTDPAAESETTPAPDPAAGGTTEKEGSPMPETTTPAAESAPAANFTQADLDAAAQRAATAALEADREARRQRKAARRTAPAESAPAAPVAESTAPAAAAAPVQESEDDMVARIVAAKIAESIPQETDEQRVQRKVQEAYDAHMAGLVQSGQLDPSRKGRIVTEAAGDELDPIHGTPKSWGKPYHQMSQEEFERNAGPVVVRHVLGGRAEMLG